MNVYCDAQRIGLIAIPQSEETWKLKIKKRQHIIHYYCKGYTRPTQLISSSYNQPLLIEM